VNVHLKLLSPEAFFSPKCTKYRLAAGLRPDPLGELTALPGPPSCIKGCLLLTEGTERGHASLALGGMGATGSFHVVSRKRDSVLATDKIIAAGSVSVIRTSLIDCRSVV